MLENNKSKLNDILYRYKYSNISLEITVASILELYKLHDKYLTHNGMIKYLMDLTDVLSSYKWHKILKEDCIKQVDNWTVGKERIFLREPTKY